MKPKAFLFDFDGTLVDTEAAWTRAIVDLVVTRGGRTSFSRILPAVVGRNWLDIDRYLHREYPCLGDSTPMQDAIELRKFYNRRAKDQRALTIKSSVDFFLKAAAVAPCAIVSGSPHDDVAAMVSLLGIADKTAFVLGAGEYDEGKPSPSGYLKAAEILGVFPEDCIVVEDSTVGVQAGVAAGMRVLALNRRKDFPQDVEGATWVVDDLASVDLECLFELKS